MLNAPRKSQAELCSNITCVGEELHGIADNLPNPRDLDPHVKRLANARRKVNIINSILTNCQERLRKLHTHINRENYRREQALSKSSPNVSERAPLQRHASASSPQTSTAPQTGTAPQQMTAHNITTTPEEATPIQGDVTTPQEQLTSPHQQATVEVSPIELSSGQCTPLAQSQPSTSEPQLPQTQSVLSSPEAPLDNDPPTSDVS